MDRTPGIHTLLGPRRIGKSTLFKLWIRELLAQGVPGETIAFLDAERFETWKELLEALERIRARFVFVDEATAALDWPRAFKVLVDEGKLEGVCVWLTGSNAFDLKQSGERLPGRRGKGLEQRDLELLPLTFREFHAATGLSDPRASFEKFLRWGGYPMAVSESLARELPSVDLLTEIRDVALGEASRRHRSPRLTAALAERLWISLGGRSSLQALARHMDAGSHPIIRQYVEVLEGCYALLECERFNAKTRAGILRKERKFYFLDPVVIAALGSFAQTGAVDPAWLPRQLENPVRKGGLVESMVAAELRKRQWEFFYDEANGGEVDFVLPYRDSPHAVEVKLGDPALSELRPAQAYRGSEVWVYADGIERRAVGNTQVVGLLERLLEL